MIEIHEESLAINGLITVKGKINLPAGKDITFPEGSFLYVSCNDTSRMDAPSITLGSTVVDVSNKSSNEEICYTLEADVPNMEFGITLSATINVGWKRDADGNEWIRKGDYLNDTTHRLGNKEGPTEYNGDITVIHYNH